MSVSPSDSPSDAAILTGRACAKINLTLDVLGRRDDGFHELRSLVIGVGLRDTIRCRLGEPIGIRFTCSDPVLTGPSNLVWRAAERLARHAGIAPALDLHLEKSIPVGAGLGGGSSDAATTLRLCNQIWRLGLERDELAAIGAELGSDVPLFFYLPSAVMTGRGERVERVALRWSGWALLVFAGPLVPTAEVYRAFRASDTKDQPRGNDAAICEVGSAKEINALTSNHLESAVLRVSPTVARVYDELQRSGMGPFRVSGAGSALFKLFDEKEAADHAAIMIERLGLGVSMVVAAAPVGEIP